MYSRDRLGNKIDPWRTHTLVLSQDENVSEPWVVEMFTICFRPLRHNLIEPIAAPLIP